jgi:hypothetical protein
MFKAITKTKIGIKYHVNGQLKDLYSVRYSTGKRKIFDRVDIREYAQKKSNEIAKLYPNTAISILLQYKGLGQLRSGGFTMAGQPVKLHDFSYYEGDGDIDDDIIGFQILFTG